MSRYPPPQSNIDALRQMKAASFKNSYFHKSELKTQEADAKKASPNVSFILEFGQQAT